MDHPDEQIMLLKPQKAKQADETDKIIDLTINAEREWATLMESSKRK